MIVMENRDDLRPFLRRWPVWALRTLLVAVCIVLLPAFLIRGAWFGALELWDALTLHWQRFGCIKQADEEGRS